MSLTAIEREEAVYNARDVLGMCRVWPHLVATMERRETSQVYEVDEQMAWLALQMTRVGMPVNSERRAEIGERLRTLRDQAIAQLRVYTEGEYRDSFIDWAATFMAVKARNGEPIAGAARVGPSFAQLVLDEAQANLDNWRKYRKTLPKDKADWDTRVAAGTAVAEEWPAVEAEIAEAAEQVTAYEGLVKQAKMSLKVATICNTDEDQGTAFTAESALEARKVIRRAQFLQVLEKVPVNFGAKVQQCAILRAAGVPLLKVTEKTGLPKIDKEVLEAHGRHAAAKALLAYILTEKTINVYIEGESRAGKAGKSRPVMVTDDGYLHPLWSPMKITGRWGSSPNVQNFSKRAGGGAENLRSMIEAPEGYVLVGADQKQLEARLIGAMSQCKYMINVFRNNEDIHSAFAQVGFPVLWPEFAAAFKEHKASKLCWCPKCNGSQPHPGKNKCMCQRCQNRDKLRDVTKRLEYGGFYGGKAQTLWESVVKDFPDTAIGQIEDFIRQFERRLPEVLAWRQQTLNDCLRTGEIRSPILGRLQLFPLSILGRVEPTVAYNYKAQSGGGDLWNLGAVEFCKLWDQEGTDARLTNNGHDSVLILCKEEHAPQVEQDIYTCWNREWNGVPFEMECQTAARWSET
jgi:hypothetical protein